MVLLSMFFHRDGVKVTNRERPWTFGIKDGMTFNNVAVISSNCWLGLAPKSFDHGNPQREERLSSQRVTLRECGKSSALVPLLTNWRKVTKHANQVGTAK